MEARDNSDNILLRTHNLKRMSDPYDPGDREN